MPSTSERMNVYAPIEREKTKSTVWLRVGVAFVNKDGSINVYLDVVPLTGKLQLRHPKDDEPGSSSGR